MQRFGGTGSEYAGTIAASGSTLLVAGAATSANIGVNGTGTLDATGFGGFLLPLDSATGKFAVRVTLSNLNQFYDGQAKPVTVTTSPSNVTTSITYNGSATVPTVAGSYPVVATVTTPNYTGTASGTLTIGKIMAQINLANSTFTYDGTAKIPTATTTPPGLALDFLYTKNGMPVPMPITGGMYIVTAFVNDANYVGNQIAMLTINKAEAQIMFMPQNLNKVYNGLPQTPLLTTTPVAGLTIVYTFNGSNVVPSQAGFYLVDATIDDINYQGSISNLGFLITKATATVQLSNLTQAFDGTPKSVSVTTNPAGLVTSVTYDGSATPPRPSWYVRGSSPPSRTTISWAAVPAI